MNIKTPKQFHLKDVIDEFKLTELLRFSRLTDFLPDINNSGSDQVILNKWKEHFSQRDVPWAITKIKERFILWKEDEVKEI
jgi:hypothetical protein